jgi:fatty-acyl-CoA synthase
VLSLIDRIESIAEDPYGDVTFISGDDHTTIPWPQLHRDARAAAAGLQARGVRPGDHVALIGPTTRQLVTTIQATWLCGAVLVTMPLPMRMGALQQFIDQTRARILRSDTRIVVIDADLAPFIQPEPGDPPFVSLDELCGEDGPGEDSYRRPPSDPDSLAVLQFTSGSTSEPKGVMLSHRAICNNLDGAWKAAEIVHEDVVVSWLPLYHDMGLVGLLTIPMTLGCTLVQGAPQDFLARPVRWMEWMSHYRGTGTAGPNFAYALATRALRRANEEFDLSRVRVLLNGAEPVDADTFRNFFEAGAPFGLRSDAAFPAFGMAEVCIAGTFPTPGEGLLTDWVDKSALESDRLAVQATPESEGSTELVMLGRPVEGLEISIVDPNTGAECAEREVGELRITGNSLTSGYYKNPDATRELIRDGWLHTGDLAYTVGGRLVVCGRIKDVIIVGGRNVYPQDIEKVAGRVMGIRTGNVIAFGTDGRHGAENIIIVAEARADDLEEVSRSVVREVADAVGIPPKEVVLVEPGTVPKTSSGKLQRSACKAQHAEGGLARLVPA